MQRTLMLAGSRAVLVHYNQRGYYSYTFITTRVHYLTILQNLLRSYNIFRVFYSVIRLQEAECYDRHDTNFEGELILINMR
jgi:hypothetical protein